MDQVKSLTDKLEEDYLKILIRLIETNTRSVLNAKSITSAYLALYPFIDIDDMKRRVLAFTQKNPDFEQIYINLLKNADELKMNTVLTRMKSLIRENKIDEALQITQ